MPAKNNAESLIVSFRRRLQSLKGQTALKVRPVGPGILTEIEAIKADIKKLQTTLAACAIDIGLKKGPLRDLNSKQRVQMYLYGDIPPLSGERQSALINALAELIGIPFQPKAIRRPSTIQFPFGLYGWDITLFSLLILTLVMGFFTVYYSQGVRDLPAPIITSTNIPTPLPSPGPTKTPSPTPTDTPISTPTPTDTPIPTPTPTDTPIIMTGVTNYDGLLNLRGGPGTEYNIISRLPYETKVTILSRTTEGDWFQVKALGKIGWVWAASVILDEPDEFAKIPVDEGVK